MSKKINVSGMWHKFFYALIVIVVTITSSFAQREAVVKRYLNDVDSNSSFIVIRSSDPLRKLSQHMYFKQIDSFHYIVSKHDVHLIKNKVHVIGNANNEWKLARDVDPRNAKYPEVFSIATSDIQKFSDNIEKSKYEFVSQHSTSNSIVIKITGSKEFESILNSPYVTFIKSYKEAKAESPNSFQDISVNKISMIHYLFPGINGEGLNVSIKEKNVDTTDIDLKNRLLPSSLSGEELSLHANQIASIIAGGGNSIPESKGAAYKSGILMSSFENLFPDNSDELLSSNVHLQNHSYGVGIDNLYGPEAMAYDVELNNHPSIIHVFSSGNSGTEISVAGRYTSVEGYANLTGNMKMAKNIITVGAHRRDMSIDERSSRGPAYDGRIKPELIAYGEEGTSDAAAVVSGACVLLQQTYHSHFDSLPHVDLIKAVLIATADEVETEGPDYISGFGALNAIDAVKLLKKQYFFYGKSRDNESSNFQIEVPPNVKSLRIALSWIDPAANAGDEQSLRNDLDLSVEDQNSVKWMPWTLSTFPLEDSLSKPARRAEDRINNIELVSVENPFNGVYDVNVKGTSLTGALQHFAIAYWYEYKNDFEWTYPLPTTPVEAQKECFLRWNNTYDKSGTIELSINGSKFMAIASQVNLNTGCFKWTVPDTHGKAILRMKVGNVYVYSTEFIISSSLQMKVEYNCSDGTLVSWSRQEGATAYQLYNLGSQFLEPVALISDTSFLYRGPTTLSDYFAVTPVLNGDEGVRSPSYNVNEQGVKCYFVNLTASQLNDEQSALLTLDLSTRVNVEKIVWQKNVNGLFTDIGQQETKEALQYSYIDKDIKGGVTQYRAQIFAKGATITTDTVYLYYADENTVEIFPNPARIETDEIQVLTDANGVILYLYDLRGVLVKTQMIVNKLFRFKLGGLTPGLYYYSVNRNSRKLAGGKILLE